MGNSLPQYASLPIPRLDFFHIDHAERFRALETSNLTSLVLPLPLTTHLPLSAIRPPESIFEDPSKNFNCPNYSTTTTLQHFLEEIQSLIQQPELA